MDTYKQVWVHGEDIEKNAFSTIMGTFVSHVMWIGDCNAPAMFQRLMTTIFCDAIGQSMHIYLDNIFVYSNTIEEHKEHLCIDPAGENLPAQQVKEITDCIIEVWAMQDPTQRSKHLWERQEQQEIDVEEMDKAGKVQKKKIPAAPTEEQKMRKNPHNQQGKNEATLTDIIFNAPNNAKPSRLEDNMFKWCVKQEYRDNKLLSLVVEKPKNYSTFTVRDKLV